MKKLLCAICLVGLLSQAHAEEFNPKSLYFGAGLSNNDITGFDDAFGFQFFGGLPLGIDLANGDLAVEVGYMDSGDFDRSFGPFAVRTDATGIWATAVGDWALNKEASLIGRLGFDFGDDDGLMFGLGLGFDLNEKIELRGELVLRDEIDSLQVNFVFRQ